MEYQYDLLVLGGGPAGYSAAIRASQNGLKVALTEQSKVGGTCLNRGCIPTKALLHSAEVLNSAKHAQEFGIFVENPSFDLGKIYERRDLVVTKLRTGVEKLLSARKVALFEGQASFVDAHTVKVGDQTVTADKILISTGSVPATLRIEGMDLCVNSDYLLEGTNEIPDNIVIVGGGVIGVEFAEFLLAPTVPSEPRPQKRQEIVSVFSVNKGVLESRERWVTSSTMPMVNLRLGSAWSRLS